MTPPVPQFRRRARSVAGHLALLLLTASGAGWAQSRPDAGSVLRETRPTEPGQPAVAPVLPALPATPAPAPGGAADEGVRFTLKSVRFAGNTVLGNDALQALVRDRIGTTVSLAELNEIARRVTERYRAMGYPLAQAVLPRQEVAEGSIEISILEGRLERVNVNVASDSLVREMAVQRLVDRQLKPGQPVAQRDVERAMLLLTDLPGVAAKATLDAGNEPGGTVLDLDVGRTRRIEVAVDADNYGSRETGENRVGILARINSPGGYGDNVDLRLQQSLERGLTYGRVGYEAPLNGNGTRAGISLAHLRYDLVKDFSAVDGNGTATVVAATVTHPFRRTRSETLIGRFGLELKDLEDSIGPLTTPKRSGNVNAGFAWERRDGFWKGGYSGLNLSLYAGSLRFRDEEGARNDADGRHTAGGFSRLALQATRLQTVSEHGTVYLGIAGQLAGRNLDSTERIALGGPFAVRAYPGTEGVSDEGFVLNAEYRYAARPDLTLSAFYDYGWGRFNHEPLAAGNNAGSCHGDPNANTCVLRGAGLSFLWAPRQMFSLRGSIAWRDGAPARSESVDRSPRVYLQFAKPF